MKELITLLALLPLLANAEVYRWQDADGNWHFGDQPPQEQHETVDIKAPPKIGQGERVREINQRTLRLRESEQAHPTMDKVKADQDEVRQWIQQHCTP